HTYAGAVRDLVRPYWRLPSYLQEQNLRCVVHVFISAQGKLLKAQIVESSHNEEFDRWALQAAQEAPYPEPPEAAQNAIVRHGLKLVFPL
ncbi:MAG: TonB C-terminal domain-containing protein, partial [Bacteriovoracaceae bacterium]|nr:TonB C-terminal domain-containing protein [Bacteriovoracaceae bacterium]